MFSGFGEHVNMRKCNYGSCVLISNSALISLSAKNTHSGPISTQLQTQMWASIFFFFFDKNSFNSITLWCIIIFETLELLCCDAWKAVKLFWCVYTELWSFKRYRKCVIRMWVKFLVLKNRWWLLRMMKPSRKAHQNVLNDKNVPDHTF